ncbi:MAG: hypothetical protein U0800_26050 [Isosphaeraceae bacterium]
MKARLGRLIVKARVDDDRLRSRLRALGPRIAREVVGPEVLDAGEKLLQAIRARVPVGEGTARDSLRLDVASPRDGLATATISVDAAAIRAAAPDHFFYFAAIEFGTDHRPAAAPIRTAVDLDWPPILAGMRAGIASRLRRLGR